MGSIKTGQCANRTWDPFQVAEADDPLVLALRRLRNRENILAEVLSVLLLPANRPAIHGEIIEMAWTWVERAGLGDVLPRVSIEAEAARVMDQEAKRRGGEV